MYRQWTPISRTISGQPMDETRRVLSWLAEDSFDEDDLQRVLPVGYISWGRALFRLTHAMFGSVDWRGLLREYDRMERLKGIAQKHAHRTDGRARVVSSRWLTSRQTFLMLLHLHWAQLGMQTGDAMRRMVQLGNLRCVCLLDDDEVVPVVSDAVVDEHNWKRFAENRRFDPFHVSRRRGALIVLEADVIEWARRVSGLDRHGLARLTRPMETVAFCKPYLNGEGKLGRPQSRLAARDWLGSQATDDEVERKASSFRTMINQPLR